MKLSTVVRQVWEDDNFRIKIDPKGTPFFYWKSTMDDYPVKEQLALAIDFLHQVRNNIQDA